MKFSLKDKGKVGKPKPKVGAFSLKKGKSKLKSSKAGFEVDEDVSEAVEITTTEDLDTVQQELVIKPVAVSTRITKQAAYKVPKEKGVKYGLNVREKESGPEPRNEEPTLRGNTLQEYPESSGDDVTEDSYKKVPVSQFGLAMLRGMGFKGSVESSNDDDDKPRPLLLGLGAQPSPIQLDPSYRVISSGYTPVKKQEK